MIRIAPSILAADFARLGEQVREAEAGGADRIHVDVMDGHFVPNLSMGPAIVQSLRPITRLPLEVHLMVSEPAKYLEAFAKAGADSLQFHLEAEPNPQLLIDKIRSLGKKVGLVINPDKPIAWFEPWLAKIDVALCMTVFPGFGGQAFLPESPGRIRELRAAIERTKANCDLEVDGGIDSKTARDAIAAGANVLVVGTGVYRNKQGIAAAIAELLSGLE
ncbi:MAG: ribulose-phosphate 3-epimerase [Gemmataceae bacterium]|nr:ribulose-phosphate 3-epimerase [Gemmataceae bacterium]